MFNILYLACCSNNCTHSEGSLLPHLFFTSILIKHQFDSQKMKLLTWMHRKFRQGSSETLKEFSLGQQFFDDHHIYQKQNHGNRTLRQGQRDGHARKSFANLETTRLEFLEGKTSTESDSEFFEGFLAIGTLGTEKIIAEPETPTFAVSLDQLAERETEVTENELRLINDELERVLAAEAKEDSWTDSSSRNSHVSNGRISHASTITLSRKSLEIPESTVTGNMICPLQEYLLGSAIEFPERSTVPKKEHRTSLGELFEKHKAEEISETKYKRREKRQDKEGEKTSTNIMKKMLKKKASHSSSRSSSATARTTEPAPAETKLSKILHKFHKKVHPEHAMSSQRTEISHKNGVKDMIPCNADYYKDEYTLVDESIATLSQRSLQKDHAGHNKNQLKPAELILGGSDSNGSRECWIKSDADYLVLEL